VDIPAAQLAGLLESAVLMEDAVTAALLAEKLHGVVAADGEYGLYNAARYRAAAAAMVGDRFQARTACQQSLEWASRIGYRAEVALTRLQLAELLLEDARAP